MRCSLPDLAESTPLMFFFTLCCIMKSDIVAKRFVTVIVGAISVFLDSSLMKLSFHFPTVFGLAEDDYHVETD